MGKVDSSPEKGARIKMLGEPAMKSNLKRKKIRKQVTVKLKQL